MANSLVKLTLESNQYERGIKQAQKSWADFTRGIGLSASKFTAVSGAIAAVTGALKVAKDAFFQNEQQLDDWGRVCNESKSIYNGFLNALNTGDISGYLSNIDTITKAARDAYNALDELSTFNAFNQIQTQKARTGFTEAVAGFRLGEGTKENVRAAAETLKKELKARQGLEQEAYLKEIARVASERGVNAADLQKALSGNYGDYMKLKEVQPTGRQMVSRAVGQFGATMSYEIPMAQTIEEKMGQALRALNDTELQSLQALGAQAYKTSEEIAQVDKQMARMLNAKAPGTTSTTKSSGSGGRSGGGKTNVIDYASDSIAAQEALVQQLTEKWRKASAEMRDGYLKDLETAKNDLDYMTGKKEVVGTGDIGRVSVSALSTGINTENPFDKYKDAAISIITPLQQLEMELANLMDLQQQFGGISSEVWQLYQNEIDNVNAKINSFKGVTVAEKTSNAWRGTASSMSTVASALESIEDPGAKIAGIIGQAIANIALGFSQATAASSGGGIFGWIAAIAGGLATMYSTIEAIHSATGFSEGGIVRGSTYSGDKIPAMLNAGEVVLSRAQASNLASSLQGVGLQGMNLEAIITGEQIRMVLNNNGRRTGRGEYVQSNFR
jgi:hypothetical protein